MNPIEYTTLSDTSWNTTVPFSQFINTNQEYSISYKVMSIDGTAVASTTLSIDPEIYQIPPSYLGFYLKALATSGSRSTAAKSFITFSSTSTVSDSSGIVTLSYAD